MDRGSLASISFVPKFLPLYPSCPSSCKVFWCLFEHLILDILGFPFFVPSDYLGFCFHFLLQCLCQLCYFSGIWNCIFLKKIFLSFLLNFPLLEPVPVSAIIDNSFLQLFIWVFILIFQKLLILLFVPLLLGWFIVCAVTVAAAYIMLFVSVMSDSFSSKSSSIIIFIPSLSFINLLFSFSLATFPIQIFVVTSSYATFFKGLLLVYSCVLPYFSSWVFVLYFI